ncbi:CoA transferase [Streptomyces sp. NPDC052077]|uniref:CoA transferase n=1 Tax=Streptomyces sp. NPDC052077 TaxID=3154757 RepID=UPI00342292BB
MGVRALGGTAKSHLAELGFPPVSAENGLWRVGSVRSRLGSVTVRSADTPGADVTTEELAQAVCAVMSLYGLREGNGPRRVGVDYTSVLRAVSVGQGLLAALLARARGHALDAVTVDPVCAVLLPHGHYLAVAEAAPDVFRPRAGQGRPPPFRTLDGQWVEIETLRADAWGSWWRHLGIDGVTIGHAWREHAARQWTGRNRVPEALHTAVAARSLAELEAAAEDRGVAVTRLQPHGRHRPGALPWTSTAHRPPHGPPPVSGPPAPGSLPLSGVTVVECTRFLQGPYAGLVLALLGARVVLVELPGGDPARGIEPVVNGCFAGFRSLHRGKHPVRLDITSAPGRRSLLELVSGADVFLQNWPAGRAERLGLAPGALWRVNPHLICAQASGWAPLRGPRLPTVATDFSAQAHAGLAYAQRPVGEAPACSTTTMLDALGGMVCAEAVLAALLHRETTGRTAAVETSLLSSARLLLRDPRPSPAPLFHPLPAARGHLALSDTPRTRAVLGVSSHAGRRELVRALADDSAAGWEHRLNSLGGAACARVRDIGDIADDPATSRCLQHDQGIRVAAPWEFS